MEPPQQDPYLLPEPNFPCEPTSCPLQTGESCCTMALTVHRKSFLKSPHKSPSQYTEPTSGPVDITSQCTDKCVVITCDDPGHGDESCTMGAADGRCNILCQTSEECLDCDGLDELLQCCTDFHSLLSEPKSYPPALPYNWNSTTTASSSSHRIRQAEFFGSSPSNQGNGSPYTTMVTFDSFREGNSPTTDVDVFASTAGKISDYSYDYTQQFQSIETSLPHSHESSPLILPHSDFPPASLGPTRSAGSHQGSSLSPTASDATSAHTCMWGNCNAHFSSLEELIKHVNAHHLLFTLSSAHESSSPQAPTSTHEALTFQSSHTSDHHKKFSCLWRDCHEFFPELVDAPSQGNPHAPYDQFAIHILSQHLGYPGPGLPPLPKFPEDYPKEYFDLYSGASANMNGNVRVSVGRGLHGLPDSTSGSIRMEDVTMNHDSSSRSESSDNHLSPRSRSESMTPSLPLSSLDEQACTGVHGTDHVHACNWQGCTQSFSSCNDLTTHLTRDHVGGGKPHYDCYWGDCGRNGQNGFTSKQKICRHLQSHTGHRPFQCKLCHQNFSEAATLQQHMRRHTREKPYLCDHPGCGKAFAITGALTIHKRTHNGHKPFKCSFCDRGFAESSNLSKHLRTHTGDRPYSCLEPGCNKTFARPDQLNRHSNVHKKKQAANVQAVVAVSV